MLRSKIMKTAAIVAVVFATASTAYAAPKAKLVAEKTAYSGETTTFRVKSDGKIRDVKWQRKKKGSKKWKTLPRKSGKTLSFTAKKTDSGSSYRAKVTFSEGTTSKTKGKKLTVATPLKVGGLPEVTYARLWKSATMETTATGDGLRFKWYEFRNGNWKVVPNETSRSFSFRVSKNDEGRKFKLTVTDAYGKTVETNATTVVVSNRSGLTVDDVGNKTTRGLFQKNEVDEYCYVYAAGTAFRKELQTAVETVNSAVGTLFVLTNDRSEADIVVMDAVPGSATFPKEFSEEMRKFVNEYYAEGTAGYLWAGVAFSDDETRIHDYVLLNYIQMMKIAMVYDSSDARSIRSSIIIHELGHCVGIGHSKNEKDVMYGTFDGDNDEMTANDVAAFAKAKERVRKIASLPKNGTS